MAPMLDDYILHLFEEQSRLGGIDVFKLKPGTKITVQTANSTYRFTTTGEQGVLYAQGGKYLPRRRKIRFAGSTFGGSMIKVGWIGYRMQMEIYIVHQKKCIVTSRVKEATIEGDGWKYEMKWQEKEDS